MGKRSQHQHNGGAAAAGAMGGPEAVRIGLFGGFRVWVGPRLVGEDGWRLRKARSLVKLLALSAGHRVHREQAMELLWPGLDPQSASNNLHQVLHAARRALEPSVAAGGGATPSGYLLLRDEQILLCPDCAVWVDVEAFEEAAVGARHVGEPQAFGAAIDLYAGELLPEDRYEAWTEERRAQLQELHLSLLTELAALHEERGEYEVAIEALGRAVAEEPTREAAHADLMRLYALSGRRREALGQYERLREVLSGDLGTEPEAEVLRLQQEIWAGDFPAEEVSRSAAVPGRAAGGKHNLPLSRTSFVGREREVLEVKRHLAMTSLLTLTGTGGCGKTRLALEVARDLVEAYPDGVWLVELAPLSEPALVAQAVAQALGVREQPGRSLTQTLQDALRVKKTLLIVDNCEHLLGAVVGLIEALLDHCPRLRVLATSRERLNAAGEVGWVVPSLTVPDAIPQARRYSEPRELEAYESVRFFVQQARQRDPSFQLDFANGEAVSQVCRSLEGIPLAVELAAARVGVLSARQLANRLEDSLELLSRGERTADPRHQSLRAALEWSHDLLGEEERVLFRRTVEIFEGTASRGTIRADPSSGAWSIALSGVSEGAHTCTAKATDASGKTSSASDPVTVTVDKQAPTGTVTINDGASRTRSRSVTLTLSATDPSPGSGVSQMRIANTQSGLSSESWVAYATTRAWTLTSGKVTKTVYAQYRDGAGNRSAVATDTITFRP